LPYSNWFNSGTTYSYGTSVSTDDVHKTFERTSVTGPSSPITTFGTVTGIYGRMILRPSGAGSTTQLSRTGGSANWDAVDESSSDGDGSYVSRVGAERRDTYIIPDVTLSSWSIQSVSVHVQVKGTQYAKAVVRTGGTDYYGSQESLNLFAYIEEQYSWTTNPGTGAAWTWSQINELECGVALRGGTFLDARCTQVWVVIEYTPT
jgi:hypothetical protein